jgi:hypothetical protein
MLYIISKVNFLIAEDNYHQSWHQTPIVGWVIGVLYNMSLSRHAILVFSFVAVWDVFAWFS